MKKDLQEYNFPNENFDISIKEIYTKELTDFNCEERPHNQSNSHRYIDYNF